MIFAIPPIFPEPIFYIASLPITNTYINSTIAVVFFILIGLLLRNKTALIPGRVQNVAEGALEAILYYVDQVTHDRKKSMKFLPIIGALFFFILFSNWLGLIPGTGSIGRWLYHEGHLTLVPILRPVTTDLNMNFAMALLAVVSSHILGIVAIGFFKYANKFVKLADIWHSFRKGGMSIIVAIVEFGVGLIEIFSEIAKVVSLSLRLFGNVFAGEVLLTVLAGLVAYFVPLPFLIFEFLVGLIQAVVFSMLTLVYLTMATSEPHGAEPHGAQQQAHH